MLEIGCAAGERSEKLLPPCQDVLSYALRWLSTCWLRGKLLAVMVSLQRAHNLGRFQGKREWQKN